MTESVCQCLRERVTYNNVMHVIMYLQFKWSYCHVYDVYVCMKKSSGAADVTNRDDLGCCEGRG